MKKECGVARDLMPLVLDEVSSDASKEMVLEHVKSCSECKTYFDQLKRDIPIKTVQEIEAEHGAFAEVTARLRRQKHLRMLRLILLGGLIACIALLGGAWGYSRLSTVTRQIGLDEYRIMLSQLQDGGVVVTADYKGSAVYLATTVQSVEEMDETTGKPITVLYVGMEKYLFAKAMVYQMQNGSVIRLPSEELSNYDEIRQGTQESFISLWKPGDTIQAASEEMEQYYSWIEVMDRFEERMVKTNDGIHGFIDAEDAHRESLMHTQWEALRAVVPEWQPWTGFQYTLLEEETLRWILEEDDLEGETR